MKKISLFALLLLPLTAYAETDWVKAGMAFTDSTVVPAYVRFTDASLDLEKASRDYCLIDNTAQADQAASKESLIAAYHQAADAWHGIQIYRAGPAQPFMRHSRIATWPGISKITNKQIAQLIKTENNDALAPDKFARASTAIQGFPALERLIFGSDKTPAAIQPGNYACKVIVTIAQNLQSIGDAMRHEWQGEHKQQIKRAGQTDSYLSSGEDVAGELLTDFYMQVNSMAYQKLGRPYSKARFRFKRAESWRSQRSLRNVKANLSSAEDYYRHLFMPAMQNSALNDEMLALFTEAKTTGEALSDSFLEAHESQPERIQHWQSTIIKLSQIIQFKMPKALNITIGFNALDGDG